MHRLSIMTLLLSVMIGTQRVQAAEQFDPAARAAVIAPYLDEQAFLVARVDLSRLDAPAIVAQLAESIGVTKQEIAPRLGAVRIAQDAFDGLKQAGCREIFTIVSMIDLPQERGFLVFPMAADGDRKKAMALLKAAALFAKKKNLTIAEIPGGLYVGSDETLARIKKQKPTPRPELAQALEASSESTAQLFLLPSDDHRRVIREMLPELPAGLGKGADLADGLQWAALSLRSDPKLSVELTIQSKSPEAAVALKEIIAAGLEKIGALKQVRQSLPEFDKLSELLLPKVQNSRLVLRIHPEESKHLTALISQPIIAARAATNRRTCVNQLRQIGIAMHNYHDVHKRFPAAASYDKNGKPLLSWRVHLLPYMQQNELYKQFRLDQPWDSPHNRALIPKMPAVYVCPSANLRGKQMTTYLAPVGKGMVFDGKQGKTLRDIRDGTSSTILIVDAAVEQAVVWTKPDDLTIDPENPLRGLSAQHVGGFQTLFCDGSVRFLSRKLDPKILRLLFTCADGKSPGDF